MTQQSKFIKGAIFDQEEGKYVEFKDIISQKPVNKIVDHAEEYIIGFLNAWVEGNLYLGIKDSGEIIGITLKRSQRDELQKNINDKLTNVEPKIPPSCYTVEIHFVHDTELNKIEDLCIVQIQVSQIEFDYLYKTSDGTHWLYETTGGSKYFKKGSSCKKLNNEEIAQEIRYRSQKNLRKELEKVNEKLEKDPENKSLLMRKVDIAKFMHDTEMMDATYKKLISLNPTNYKTRVAYASAHKSIGDLEGALSIIKDALQGDEKNPDILKEQGEILFRSKRINEALETYQILLEINPDDYTILTAIGITFRELGNYKNSIKFLNYAISKYPNYRAAKYEKKKTYSKMFKGGIGIYTTN